MDHKKNYDSLFYINNLDLKIIISNEIKAEQLIILFYLRNHMKTSLNLYTYIINYARYY